jgi:hypothetical protein
MDVWQPYHRGTQLLKMEMVDMLAVMKRQIRTPQFQHLVRQSEVLNCQERLQLYKIDSAT